ncbi:hypothetical protein B0T26DRAFT_658173 [Lasiosphaeria miniovina]|uniref:DUF7924 domain-containing protein n=1 Tax=Lasiosphaeria miniovina TaxID=1954250 RepID=A0AA40DJR2_9PEZI|nr:uncharacterized protein B0T26DRAFT_658173 [Lasiosphaeria miniovina]KAK0703312.1 hypothetical protein B0T26DRAFT_658173 [Lasiosphaeria miniovina]
MLELSPEVVVQAIHELEKLGERCKERDVCKFFEARIFPADDRTGSLSLSGDANMACHLVPNEETGVTQPRPDLLYGYHAIPTFTLPQRTTLRRLHKEIQYYADAFTDLLFPFLVLEFKADAGTNRSLWTAANQCAGGLAACIQVINQLNARLWEAGADVHIPNRCYSLAINNTVAQLYVAWRDENQVFYIQRVASFLLSDNSDFIRLHQWVAAILYWGYGVRLGDIRLALDDLRKAMRSFMPPAEEHRRLFG